MTLLPVAVPARAISVPVLLLLDGKEVRVGDPVDAVARTLGRGAEVGRQLVDRGALGDRLTRFLRAPRHAVRARLRAVRAQRHDASGWDLSAVGDVDEDVPRTLVPRTLTLTGVIRSRLSTSDRSASRFTLDAAASSCTLRLVRHQSRHRRRSIRPHRSTTPSRETRIPASAGLFELNGDRCAVRRDTVCDAVRVGRSCPMIQRSKKLSSDRPDSCSNAFLKSSCPPFRNGCPRRSV